MKMVSGRNKKMGEQESKVFCTEENEDDNDLIEVKFEWRNTQKN